MNHIYKVVFCRATGTFVAVAEYAKAQGKKGGNTVGSVDERSEETSLVGGGIKFAYTSLVSASLIMVGGQAMATPVVGNSATCFYDVTSQSVVCGDDTTSTVKKVDTKTAKSVVFGKGATNTGESNVAVGILASSAGTSSVALGDRAKAGSDQTIAVGQNAQANARWDISIGRQAGWNATAPAGDKPEGRNVAIGDAALKNGLDVNNNNVMGTSAGENLKGSHNVIIGTYANAAEAIKSAEKAGSTDVQINTKTRKVAIINGDTGLPNGEQDAKYIETTNSVAIGHRALTTKTAGVAIGQQAKAFGTTSSAVGNGSRALGDNSVAMGNTANAGAGGAIAIGQQANYQPEVKADLPKGILQDISAGYKTTGANSIAIGVRTNATSNHSIAMGTEAKATANGAVAVGSESNTSGVNATAIGQASEAKGKNSFAAGNDAHAVGTSAVAVGDGAGKGAMTIEEYKAGNYTNAASGDSSTAVGVYTKAKGAGSTAIGLSANAQTTRSVAVGAESSVAANQGIAIGDTAQVIEKGLESYWDTNTKSYKLRDSVSVGAMAVGSIAKAQGYGSVAVGRSSETVFMNSTAVGHVAKALGYNSTAMGFEAMAKGVSSVAIGDKALAGTQDPVTHLPINSRGVAIGVNSNATGETAVTIGSNADVRVSRGTALGVLSQVTQRDGVALGSNSIANRSEGVAGVDPLNAKNASAPAQVWTATHAAVSVGNDTKHTGQRQGNSAQIAPWEIPVVTRQITNVAAGSQDTDAVNVAQLRAAGFVLATAADTQAGGVATTSANTSTDNKIVNGETLTLKAGKGVTLNQDGAEVTITTDLSKADKTHYFSVNHDNTLQGVGNNYNNDGATGRNALAAGSHAKATGEESTAIGHDSSAEGKQSVAVGYKAKAKGEHALAIGDVAEAAQWGTAVGYGSRAEGVGSPIAIGTNSQTIGGNSPMAIGDWATANGSGAIAIGSKIGGAHEADKSTFAQGDKAIALGYLTKATQRDAMALGAETSATAESTVAIGKKAQATDSNSISIGRQSGSAGIDLDNKGANNNADITSRTKAGKTNANGLVNVTSIGNEAGSGTINNNYGVNIGYQAGSGGYNSYYGEGVSIGNKAGGVDKTNATVKTAMEAFSAGQGATDNTIITGNTNTAISSRAGVNALGHDNVAIGKDAGGYSSGSSNIAIGRHAGRASKLNTPNNEATRVIDGDVFSNARNTISMGEWANASSDDATAVGRLASASGASSMALGHQATAKPEKSVAIGYNARAVGTETSSISIGENAYNNASGALVIGKDASAKGFADVLTTGASPAKALPYNAIAIGKGANVDTLVGTNGTQERSTDAIAIGTDAKANYASTIAIGYGAKANTKSSATAIGLNSDAQGWKSLAVGVGAVAKQTDSVALGSDSVADIGFNEVGVDPLNAKEDGTVDSPIWKSTKAAVSVGNINHADPNKRVTRQITSVAAGKKDTDAVNVAQLRAAGFKLTTSESDGVATSSTEEKVKNGDTVTIDAGKNIKVTQTGSKVSIATKDNVTFNSVEIGNVYIDEANDDIIGLSNTFLGDDNFAADGRAATEEQLNETQDNLVRILGGNAKNNDGTVSTNNIGGTGKHTIDEAVQFVHDKTATTPLTIEGNKVAPLDPANTNKLVTAGDIANAINNTGFTLTTATTNDGELGANSTNNQLIKAGDTVTVEADNNIKITQADGKISVATKNDVKFDSVVAGGTKLDGNGLSFVNNDGTAVTNSPSISKTGINAGNQKITNVADGVIAADSKDAVNGGQLHAVKTTAESKLGAFTVGTDKNATAQGITVDKDKARFDIVGADNGKVMTQVDGNKIAVDLTADAKNSLAKADSALQSIQVKANGTAVTTLDKDNNTLDITQGDNITVSNDGGKVKVALNQDVTGLNSLTSKTITAGEGTNQVVLDNDGVKVGGNAYISANGLNANDKKITNVTNGDVTATSKDAINGSQLHTVSTATKNLMGGNATVNTNGTVTASNIGGTNANTIDDAIKTVKTTVKSTDNSIKVTANTADKTNGTVFDISVNAQGLAESAQLPVVYTKADGTKVYKVGSKFFDNKEGTGTEIEATNIIASMQNADGTITPTTLANIKAGTKDTDAVNVSQLKGVADTLGGGASINADGTINAPTYNITNPADGGVIKAQNVGDALNALNTAVNNPLAFAGDTGLFNRNLGQTTTIKGGVTDENKLSNSNIGVVAKDGTLDIKLAKDITIDSVTTGNTTVNNEGVTIKAPTGNNTVTDVKLTANGLNNGGNKITNVADGEIVAGSKDAVNGGQLFNIKQDIVTNATNVAKGLSFAGNTGEFNSQLGDKVTVSGGLNDASITSSNTNIRTVAKDGKVDIQFADAPVFTGKVSAKGLDAGNQKITGVLAGDDKTDAVNVEQLSKALANVTVANQSLVQANSPFSYINKAGEQLVRKVAVVNGKSVVTFEKAKDGSIYTGDDITITALNPTDPQTTIPTLIGNVKAGINDNDVVNVSQLKGVAEVLGAGTTVDADGSIKKPSYTVTGNTYNNVGGALQALNSEVEKPFTFIDDNGEKIARKLGENITVKGGATSNLTKNNIGVVANSATGELNVQLAETVNLGQNGSVAMGDSVINHAGLTIKSPTATNPNNTVSLTANGLNNGGNKISHVADGLIAKDSKDAVNGGQLSAVKDVADSALQTIKVKANGTDVKELTKDNNELNIKGDSNITVTNDNGEVKVDLADVITVGSPNNATGATNNPIKIDGEKGTITGLTNKDLTAADFAKAGRAATEEQLKIVDNFAVKYDTDPTSGNPNKDSVTFAGTPATPAIKAVDDKFTMAGGTVLNNVASAGDYTQAVNAYKATNAGDLNNAVIDVTNKGLKFAGNVGNEFTAKLGTTVGIKGGMVESTPTSATSGDNVITRTDNHGNINIELAKNAKFDSVITGSTKIDNNGLTFVDNAGKPVANSPSISQTGINAGNQRITGVLAGDDKTDAVNVEQLSKALANITVTNQSIVQANSPFSYVNTAGEQLIREVKTVNGKKEVAFKKAKDGTAYTGDDITIAALNPADPQTTLPTTIGNVKAGVQANDAVNVSQLKDMVTALGGGASIQDDGSLKAPEYTIHKTDGQAVKVNNVGDAVQALNNEVTKPLTFIGDNGEKVTRKLGENITVKGGATGNLTKNNIGVVANPATGELNVQLAETVNLGQNGSVAMGNTLVNNTGITVGDKVALTNTGLTTGDITVNAEGINAGNKAISNVANGVNANDAVNVSQLKAVQDSMKTASVTAGSDTITVSKTTNGNNTDYTIDLANSTKADIAKGVDAKNAVDTKGLIFTADAGKTTAKKLGDSIAITGDKNISTNATADGVKVSLNENIAVKEVKADTSTIGSVTINNAGINMGDKQITGLASGLNGKTLEDIKADLTAPERNNAATVGDLATVQNNVTNITNHYNTIIGGTNKDGQVLDANGKPIQDNTGKNIDVADALKTYNVQDNKAKTDNTIITAIKNMNEGGIKFFHVNDGTGEQNVEGSDIHQEDSTASGSYAAAVGYQAKATGKNANAMGKDAQALGDNSMAFGTGNIVRGNNSGAFGDPSIINGSNSYSIGNNNRIGSTTNNAFALGNDVYLGADASGNDTTSVNGAVALGNKASVTVAGGVALGENSVANRAGLGSIVTTNSGDNVDASKNQVYALAEASDKDKKAIIATAQNSASAVSVGKEGANRQITNVAAGSADSDAVNVAQLKAVARTLPIQYANTANEVTLVGDTNPDGSSNSGPVKIQNLAAGTQATDAVNVSQLAMLDNKLDNAVNQLGYKLGDVEKNANAGISAAMATAALPQAYISGKSMVSGGMASYNGQGAVAFGMSKLSDNGRWVIKISGTADTQGNAGGSIGAGFHW